MGFLNWFMRKPAQPETAKPLEFKAEDCRVFKTTVVVKTGPTSSYTRVIRIACPHYAGPDGERFVKTVLNEVTQQLNPVFDDIVKAASGSAEATMAKAEAKIHVLDRIASHLDSSSSRTHDRDKWIVAEIQHILNRKKKPSRKRK